MRQIITALLLAVIGNPVFAEDAIKTIEYPKVKTLALKPPKYSIDPSVKHAEKRKAKALKWYIDHLGRNTVK